MDSIPYVNVQVTYKDHVWYIFDMILEFFREIEIPYSRSFTS